jgi:5-oxoprolinase (ATP-hydrolysing) subunit A
MRKVSIDLNSDMGEGFGPWRIGDGVDEQMMPFISSANVATGFHAGDPNIMARTVELAKREGVRIGAHPGFRDLVGFGRREISEGAQALVNDILYQLGALREFARLHGLALQHVKPHGALYMLAARDEALSRLLVATLQKTDPTLLLYCMESSVTFRVAREMGQPVIREFYADREYSRTGSIVFTRNVKRLDPERVVEKVLRACIDGRVATVEGDDIAIDFDSICIHSDTPGALELVEATHAGLTRNGIEIAAPSAAS